MIPFIDLKAQQVALRADIDAAIARVLDHGQYILGPEVAELEEQLAALTGARHCVTMASGTEALIASLMALGIGAGDEVITTPFTFAATAEAIVLVGATPVFVDIEADTCNIDATRIAAAVTPATRAIMPVSLYGQVADMITINAIAAAHGLFVIEDAAQSLGATLDGRQSGALSTIGCTSFFPSKPLGCYGDGGALFTDDEAIAQIVREIRVHGQDRRYHHARIGLGGRMDTLQCAIVLAKLGRLDWEIAARARIGARYNRLCDDAGVERVTQRAGRSSVYAQYTIMVPERAEVAAALAAAGIPTAIHYPIPLDRQPAYRDRCRTLGTPRADRAAERVLSLPMHADLGEATQDRIVAELVRALRNRR